MKKTEKIKKRKILFIFPSLRFGLRYWKYFFEKLERHHLKVEVLTSYPPYNYKEIDYNVHVVFGKFIKLKTNKNGYASGFMYHSPKMIFEILKIKPDLIITIEYTLATFFAIIAAHILNTKVVIFQEHRSRKGFEPNCMVRNFRKFLTLFVNYIIANTKEAKEELEKNYKIDKNKILYIPILMPPEKDVFFRKKIEIPETKKRPVFLYVGQLIRGKNVEIILRATAKLKEEGFAFTVWIVGDGELRYELENLTKKLNIEDYCMFMGKIPYEGLGYVYQSADVLIMPTLSDYRSVAVIEGMSFGIPIIDSKFDGNANTMVIDKKNGFIFDPKDAKMLIKYMKYFILDKESIFIKGEQSIKIYNFSFNNKFVINNFINILDI